MDPHFNELIIRIDERVEHLIKRFDAVEQSFVRKDEFKFIKIAVISLIGITATYVINAVLGGVLASF